MLFCHVLKFSCPIVGELAIRGNSQQNKNRLFISTNNSLTYYMKEALLEPYKVPQVTNILEILYFQEPLNVCLYLYVSSRT